VQSVESVVSIVCSCYSVLTEYNRTVVAFSDTFTKTMENNKLLDILRELGLSENESRTYLSLISLGPSTVLKISKASGINRTSLYSMIDALKQKGLISIDIKGFKKLLVAESPEKLEVVLEDRKRLFKKNLPDFMSLYNSKGEAGFLRYHEGLESIKSVYESMLRDIKPGEDYLIVSDAARQVALDRKYFMDFIERRGKLPIKVRMLMQDSEDARYLKQYEQNFNYKAKLLPAGTSLSTNLVVIPERILIHQTIDPVIGIVIENKSAIKMHQEMFEIMWRAIPE